jgi:hypothetical protein
MVHISYHPSFVVQGSLSSAHLKTFSVSPSYLAFTVPFGVDKYTVKFERPAWQTWLSGFCFVFMGILAILPLLKKTTIVPRLKKSKAKIE